MPEPELQVLNEKDKIKSAVASISIVRHAYFLCNN